MRKTRGNTEDDRSSGGTERSSRTKGHLPNRVRDVVFTRRVAAGRDSTSRASRISRTRSQRKSVDGGFHCDYTVEEMNELDENGWAHIHHASFRGFVKSVEKFVKAGEDQLELETGDDLKCTPLLLAVMSGNLETVKCIVELGANVSVLNSQNHGVVELCAFKQFITLLEYFVEINHEKLPVWKNLVKFLGSDVDDEIEAAAKCIRTMTQDSSDGINPNWRPAFDSGLIPVIVKVIKGSYTDDAKIPTFHVMLNVVSQMEVKDQSVSSGMLSALIKLLKPVQNGNNYIIQLAAQTLKEICCVAKYAEQAVQQGAISALVKVIQSIREPEVLVQIVNALGTIVQGNPSHQQTLGSQPGALSAIVNLFDDCVNKPLLLALTKAVSKTAYMHKDNQTSLVNEGVGGYLGTLCRVKHKEVQLSAVEAIHRLAENNPVTQKAILDVGVVAPLLDLMKKSRQPSIQESTATALWALAGKDVEERRTMASLMGVQLLIEFLSSLSEDLHFIGSEGLGVLAQGPLNEQGAIGQSGGVHPLVRLLRSDKEHIVLSAIRTIQHLCVGVGYVPHEVNQGMVAASRGIKFLVALMVHSVNPIIQVEAAHALGCVALGNSDNLDEIQQNMDFSYVRVLKMMYADDATVRLLAGAALAAFAYNNLHIQKDIAEQGGVRFPCFAPFLQSDEEYFRCLSAFQVVVLARIIPDEEQAISSAAGIKLLVDLLQDSRSDIILSLTADCIARLAHTRAGVPSALVSIQAVNLLSNLLLSPAEQVRGNAAIALGYLSYNHQANRQLLNRCRVDPYLMKIILYYTNNNKLSPDFIEGWKHYKQIGLPPIQEGRPSLVGKKLTQHKETGRAMTITSSADETGTSTNLHSSPLLPSNTNNITEEDRSQGMVRHSSRELSNSITPRQSHRTGSRGTGSCLSRRNSLLSNEATPELTITAAD